MNNIENFQCVLLSWLLSCRRLRTSTPSTLAIKIVSKNNFEKSLIFSHKEPNWNLLAKVAFTLCVVVGVVTLGMVRVKIRPIIMKICIVFHKGITVIPLNYEYCSENLFINIHYRCTGFCNRKEWAPYSINHFFVNQLLNQMVSQSTLRS